MCSRFNPRPRVAGDQDPHRQPLAIACFNPRPRVAGDRDTDPHPPAANRFNPRPRVAGDRRMARYTPARNRFNPRPRVAGDGRPRSALATRSSFNPRPRVAGDAAVLDDRGKRDVVSIHARVWRATGSSMPLYLRRVMFQSTPACGGRRLQSAMPIGARARFNPRPRVAGDAGCDIMVPVYKWFQSTPACGGRPAALRASHSRNVSIHARVWRAT